jgi:hypothetical protein
MEPSENKGSATFDSEGIIFVMGVCKPVAGKGFGIFVVFEGLIEYYLYLTIP